MARAKPMIAETVALPVGPAEIEGDLRVPAGAKGIVVFAHGSGSSRFSTRNRAVAGALEGRDLGTFLLDLLTPEEEAVDARTAEYRFDIPRLGGRVVQACDWLREQTEHTPLRTLPIGTFGASTGAAAALIAAAERPDVVCAVVSRGGRPDLAGDALPAVTAPTLLIVGGSDYEVIELNRAAMAQMRAPVRLEIVPHATHLFEEPGALAQVAALAADWFTTHLHQPPLQLP
jgi:pimeloyl-ACP methyl ester carboxylesterase